MVIPSVLVVLVWATTVPMSARCIEASVQIAASRTVTATRRMLLSRVDADALASNPNATPR